MKTALVFVTVLAVICAGNAAPLTRFLVTPGFQVPLNVMPTWQNGYASWAQILFSGRPYALGWWGSQVPVSTPAATPAPTTAPPPAPIANPPAPVNPPANPPAPVNPPANPPPPVNPPANPPQTP